MPTAQFLHQLERRARQAHSPLERHQAAFYLWEFGLRMLGCVSVIEYADSGVRDPKLESALQNLSRPALGHWWELVRHLVPVLAANGDKEFRKIEARLLGKSSDSLWDVIKLDVALRKVLNPNEDVGSRQTVRLRELFDRLIRYRNNEWHGFLGGREAEFYEDMSTSLVAGVWELWQHIDVLAGLKLIFVEDVRRLSDGSYRVVRWDLSDEKAEALSPLDLSTSETAALPLPGRLYLASRTAATQDGDSVSPGRLLYPLALYELPQQELFLYGGADRRKGNVAYIGSMSGEHPQDVDVKDRRELLQRLLSRQVTDEQVHDWTEASRIDDASHGDPRLSLSERREIGEFQLISRLGSGGFGTVYRAWQPAMRREVAVKRLSNPGKPEQRQRFSREVQALGRVDHPHLVKVFHSGTDGEDLFFAMELIEGADLERVLQGLSGKEAAKIDSNVWHSAVSQACESARSEETPLSNADDSETPSHATSPIKARARGTASRFGKGHVRHTVELIRDVADAVQCLHDADVLHRDIKPGNIMITPQGEAIVMDLGLAQLGDADTLTKSRQFVGTIRYSSPEQAFSSRGLDARSDIYSLGATFWELLTLHPFLGITKDVSTDQQFARIRRDDPEPVTKYNAHVPSDLARIVAKCVEKDETRRYRSMADLVDDLNRWLRGEPVLAQDPSIGYLLRKAIRKHRKLVAGLTSATLTLITLTIGIILFLNYLRDQEKTARQQAEGLAEELKRTVVEKEKLTTDLKLRSESLARQTARLYIEQGVRDYDQGRLNSGCIQLLRARALLPKTASLRASADALAIDRLTRHGQSPALFHHQDSVNAVAFAQDGIRVATGSEDKTVRVWNAATGLPVTKVFVHAAAIQRLDFTPDGKRLCTWTREYPERHVVVTLNVWDLDTETMISSVAASLSVSGAEPVFCEDRAYAAYVSVDGAARVIDVWNGKFTPSLKHDVDVYSVAISPDGSRVATSCVDNTVRVWNVSTGKIETSLDHESHVVQMVFTHNGTRILTQSNIGVSEERIRLWDLATEKEIDASLKTKTTVDLLFVHPDSDRLVTRSGDTLSIWDASIGEHICDIEYLGLTDYVRFNPNGMQAVTKSSEGVIQFWDTTTGEQIGLPFEHGEYSYPHFSPDGTRVGVVTRDGAARLLDSVTGKPIPEFLQGQKNSHASGVWFTSDGSRVLTWTGGLIHILDPITGRSLSQPLTTDGRDKFTALSLDGTRLVMGMENGTARVWELSSSAVAAEPFPHDGDLEAVAFAHSGHVLTADHNSVYLWHVGSRRLVWKWEEYGVSPRYLALSDDRSMVAVGSAYSAAQLLETFAGTPVRPQMRARNYNGNDGNSDVKSLAFSPDGTTLVIAYERKSADLWDLERGELIGNPLTESSEIVEAVFSLDGREVLAICEDGKMRMWSANTGALISERSLCAKTVGAAEFDGNNGRVVMAVGTSVQIYDVESGRAIGKPMIHSKRVWLVTISQNGMHVATGSGQIAQVWDCMTGERIGPQLVHSDSITSIGLSADGMQLIAGTTYGAARIWEISRRGPVYSDRDAWFEVQTRVSIDENGNVSPLSPKDLDTRLQKLSLDTEVLKRAEAGYAARTAVLLREKNRTLSGALAAADKSDGFAAAFNMNLLLQSGLWLDAEIETAVRSGDSIKQYGTAWFSVLVDLDADQAAAVVNLAQQVVDRDPDNWSCRETLGAALYRHQQLDKAVDLLLEAATLHQQHESEAASGSEPDTASKSDQPESSSVPAPRGAFITHAFLVMAYHELDKPEDVEKHRNILDSIEETSDPNELGWQERLRRQLLRKEIESLLGPRFPEADSSPDFD